MEMMSSFFHPGHQQHLFQTKPHFGHFMADDTNGSRAGSGSATRHSGGGRGGGGGGGSDTESRDSDQSSQTQQSPEIPGSKSSPESKYPEYCRTLTVTDANGQVKELVFPKALDLDRPKRARTTFSSEQLYQLEKDFQKNQYLVGRERTELAQRLNLSETQVKVWFQNRRTKFKRDKQRQAESREAKAESMAACNIMRLLENRPAQTAPIPVAPSMPFVLPPPLPPPGLFGRPFS